MAAPANQVTRALQTILGDGIAAAAQALVDVCRDDKAPTAARVQAAAHIFRAAGLLGGDESRTDPERVEDDMTVDALKAQLRKVQSAKRKAQKPPGE